MKNIDKKIPTSADATAGKEEGKKHDIKDFTDKLALAEKERDEYLNGWKRAKADLVNFKKDTAEMVMSFREMAGVEFIANIIPVLEAFEEAEKNNVEGLVNIWDLFFAALEKEGVEIIAPREGEKFNPRLHEAISGEGGRIESVLQRGYKLKDRVLKPAKVRVE